mmetsp:Transcript_18412/g.33138  ORF Transcript_18412/g.33138 Transcript_18412/m.33138 type:complete len:178 (-) Transcript_18412:836-1369(-)
MPTSFYKHLHWYFIAFNVGLDMIYFVALMLYYFAKDLSIKISIFIVVYNVANSLFDFGLLAYSGWSLLGYLKVYFPNLNTSKVSHCIWASAAFYLGRSLLLVALYIVYFGTENFKDLQDKDCYVGLKLAFYLMTDLVFLGLLNCIIREQVKQDKSIQKHSEESRNALSDIERTLYDM